MYSILCKFKYRITLLCACYIVNEIYDQPPSAHATLHFKTTMTDTRLAEVLFTRDYSIATSFVSTCLEETLLSVPAVMGNSCFSLMPFRYQYAV